MPPTEPAPSATPEASTNSGQQLASELVAAQPEQSVATAETVVSATPVAEYKAADILDPLEAASRDAAQASIHYAGRDDHTEPTTQSGMGKPGKIAAAIAAGAALFGSLFMMGRSSDHDAQPAQTSPAATAPASPPTEAQPTAGEYQAPTVAPAVATAAETPAPVKPASYAGAHDSIATTSGSVGPAVQFSQPSPPPGEVGPAVQFHNGDTTSTTTPETTSTTTPPSEQSTTTTTPQSPTQPPQTS